MAASSRRPKVRTQEPAVGDGPSTDRRTQIVATAATLFAEFGYEATSVRQIADAVNILAGSLYHHFATKEEMLHEVLKAQLPQLTAENQRMAMLPVDAEHRLVASVIWRFRQYVERWAFHTILLQEGRFFRRHKAFAYAVKAKSQAFTAQQSILSDGMSAGLFRPDIDTYLMIGTISRLLSSAAAWFRSGDIFSAEKPAHYSITVVIDFHLDCVLRMVRAPARLAEPIPRASCEKLLQLPLGR